MNASVAEAASVRTRPRLRPNSSKTKAKKNRIKNMQYLPSQQMQKPHNWQPKSRSTSPIKDTGYVADTPVAYYQDAPWYKAGEGDLLFAQWLLNRCNGVGDTTTPQSEAATQRLFALYKVQRKLRRELAMGSKRDETSAEKVIDEEADEEEHVRSDEPLWSVEEIVEHVGDVLRVSRRELLKQKKLAVMNCTKLEGSMERTVVAEVVDNATDLILSRGTSEQEMTLRRWMTILKEDRILNEVATVDVYHKMKEEDQKIKKKKMRVQESKTKAAEDTACEQVESFLVFLQESAKAQTLAQASVNMPALEMVAAWTAELQCIVELSSIEPEEEERRRNVALDIQTLLRRTVPKWRNCEVVLFGSSLTHFGSRHSDLDMCLIPNERSVGKNIKPPMEMGQLQRPVDRDVGEKSHIPAFDTEKVEPLQDLSAEVQKSIENLTQALNSLDRSSKIGVKQRKQRRQLEFFYTQMRLLHNAIVAQSTQCNGVVDPRFYVNAGKSARLKTLIAADKRSSEDLYLLRALLQRAAKCEVRHVIAGARVPIIRFLLTRSGREFECDLCFENYLATRNTSLLRAYAAFDDRARALGLVVKHWAKQRAISDASMGFLSSYSFVLLSIYYLQVTHVLPNLQDPQLLESANIPPEYYNGINIAFCEDRAVAQAFYKHTWGKNSSDVSLTTLLAGFFEFYALQFDFAHRVVSVRSPELFVSKLAQWGKCKAKTWRISIQDPLETGRDLGCVLQFKGQEKIIRELRRAREMMARGKSFSDEVCAIKKAAVDKTIKQRQSEKKEVATARKVTMEKNLLTDGEQAAEKKQQSYVMILQSADIELPREAIAMFFRVFQKSFRVTNVMEIAPSESVDAGNENKRWAVELLTQGPHCPRALSQKTRIDWKAADGRVGRVWVHHRDLFSTPPCQNCLSPEHATSNCLPDKTNDDKSGGGRRNRVLPKSVRRHVLRLTLREIDSSEPATMRNRRNSEPAKKSKRRYKQEQQHAAAHVFGFTENPKGKPVKCNHRDKSSRRANTDFQGDRKAEVAVGTTMRRVETAEIVKLSTTRSVNAKLDTLAQVKKKWRRRASSTKASS